MSDPVKDPEWACCEWPGRALRAEKERGDAFAVAMRAADANTRAQLEALGLAERFPSLTHLADDMGEALIGAERERDALQEALREAAAAIEDLLRRLQAAEGLLARATAFHDPGGRGGNEVSVWRDFPSDKWKVAECFDQALLREATCDTSEEAHAVAEEWANDPAVLE